MLFEIYGNLLRQRPQSDAQLYGSRVEIDEKLWLAITEQAFPCLLFPSERTEGRADITLRAIDVEFSRACEIATPGAETTTGIYTIVRLNDGDPDIARIFLRLLEEAFFGSTNTFTNRQIGDKILELADLFSRLEETGGDLIGLWGELHVIVQSPNICRAVQCWCAHKHAKFDFVSEQFALEVKTTIKPRREHSFSLEQVRPCDQFNVYVASIQLIEVPAGKRLSELIEEILGSIDDDALKSSFFNHCLTKGGKELYRSVRKFQPLPDKNAVAIFEASQLPVPHVDPVDPITNVRFDIDLSDISKIDSHAAQAILCFPSTKNE